MPPLATLTVGVSEQTPGIARAWLTQVLSAWDLIDPDGDVRLMLSELVTNAVRYAPAPITLSVARADGTVEIGVSDPDPAAGQVQVTATAPAADPASLAEHGRGLHIVAALADDWGVTALPDGKRVWFRYSLPHETGARPEGVPTSR